MYYSLVPNNLKHMMNILGHISKYFSHTATVAVWRTTPLFITDQPQNRWKHEGHFNQASWGGKQSSVNQHQGFPSKAKKSQESGTQGTQNWVFSNQKWRIWHFNSHLDHIEVYWVSISLVSVCVHACVRACVCIGSVLKLFLISGLVSEVM